MWENPGPARAPRGPSWAAGVILAAGASRRMGGYPKAALRIGTEASIARITRLALEADLDPIVVVVGPHAEATRAHLRDSPVTVIENPRWADGRTGSLQAGLAPLESERSVVVWPVDHPFVQSSTVSDVGRIAARDALALWVVPTYHGRGGHPVILRPPVLSLVREMGRSEPLHNLMNHFGPQVRRVEVDDAGVVANVDTWGEYDRHMVWWRARAEERWTVG